MVSDKNIQAVKELETELEKAHSVILADFQGLSVDQLNELRSQLKDQQSRFKIVKNTLLKLALEKSQFPTPGDHFPLSGPTAVLIAYQEQLESLKTLYQFFQDNDRPVIKFGFLAKKLIGKARLIQLAQLPSRQQLQAELVSRLNSPLAGLSLTLQANLSNLIIALQQVQQKKEVNNNG